MSLRALDCFIIPAPELGDQCSPNGSVANSAGRSGKVNLDHETTGAIPRRNFEDGIILLCVRWYLLCSLSHRDLK
jgi:hypothetical protein